ncbi:UNVERIFIED_CONTAM: hypothetical protein K2H54_077613 [Gekko kuhli]
MILCVKEPLFGYLWAKTLFPWVPSALPLPAFKVASNQQCSTLDLQDPAFWEGGRVGLQNLLHHLLAEEQPTKEAQEPLRWAAVLLQGLAWVELSPTESL